ncbi:MAG: hypothetical protein ACPIOQ_09540, partial [Promethearchaeia archaeon]
AQERAGAMGCSGSKAAEPTATAAKTPAKASPPQASKTVVHNTTTVVVVEAPQEAAGAPAVEPTPGETTAGGGSAR